MATQQSRQVCAGELIFREGEAGDCAYLIEHGQVLVYVTNGDTEIPIKTLNAGEVFGEMALIDDRPRSASCRAASDGQLIVVTKWQLQERISAADPVVRLLMKASVERLRSGAEILRGDRPLTVSAADRRSPDRKPAIERIALESRLAEALHDDEFVLFYQPILDISTGAMRGCEALLRWMSKDRGLIHPASFIDVMEDSALIVEAGRMVVEKALGDMHRFTERFGPDFFMSINVSGRQLMERGFIDHLEACRAQLGLRSDHIKLEVTERIMTSGHQALSVLHEARSRGYDLGIDDFGTGFSSLQYLTRMPLTHLKIDRSFVSNMARDRKSLVLVKSLANMADLLGLKVVAEGIETEEEVAMLRQFQVHLGQGYLFAKPLPLDEFLQLPHTFRS